MLKCLILVVQNMLTMAILTLAFVRKGTPEVCAPGKTGLALTFVRKGSGEGRRLGGYFAGLGFAQIREAGALSGVDVVSGATIAYNQFTEAVEAALAAAQ
ncbi:MAG: FMN-binding protein [Oscillospiraceae bacterium]|nr:FMN-binding protein [Oscillospiraceae bacterium]